MKASLKWNQAVKQGKMRRQHQLKHEKLDLEKSKNLLMEVDESLADRR